MAGIKPSNSKFIEEAKKLRDDGLRVHAFLSRQHEVIKVFGSYQAAPDLCVDQFLVGNDGTIQRSCLLPFYKENDCYWTPGNVAGLKTQ